MPSRSASSSSVGARPSSCSSLEFASSMSRARERTERGTQSSERSSSMIAPRIALHREGLEADLAVGVEALHRLDQADHPVGDQVGLVDVRGQPRAGAAGDELDQGRVGDDEALPSAPRRPPLCTGARAPGARTPLPPLPSAFHLHLGAFLKREDDCERTGFATRMAQLGCKPASSRDWRAREAPGCSAGPPLPPADGSRRSAAARVARPRRRWRPRAPSAAGAGARPTG